MSLWNEKDAKRIFQILPFDNLWKGLKNIDLLHELPFYDELNIRQSTQEWYARMVWYARSYKVVMVDSKNPLAQLEASKSSIKDLFKDLLDKIKGFKYQIIVTHLLRNHKGYRDIKYSPVYFNSITKTVFSRNFIQNR